MTTTKESARLATHKRIYEAVWNEQFRTFEAYMEFVEAVLTEASETFGDNN